MDLLTERIFAKWSTPAMKNYVHLVCKSLSTELLEWPVCPNRPIMSDGLIMSDGPLCPTAQSIERNVAVLELCFSLKK